MFKLFTVSNLLHFFNRTPRLRYYTDQTDMHGGGQKEDDATLPVNRWLNISEYPEC